MSDSSFMTLALRGTVLSDEIEDFVEAWHASASMEEIYEFLGMSFEEYSLWASNPDTIDVILSARHVGQPLREAVNDNLRVQERIAARADEAGKLAILSRWIAAQPDR
ncbi:hypothetical protein E5A73_12355 [Sphingomonas gei]|uniref:Uncharacterized protein n=1 Tax=Sphingomonas gei TaxID=1395960 RepID=A0A4S1XB96_9SPHN|nr:hypothetical protein E5A73_12355 [Sphingomonas gei]